MQKNLEVKKKVVPLQSRLRKAVQKFIEKTENCTRSKYREYNKIYREALISLWNYKCQYQARNLYYYTMKSLILAQDER